MAEKGRYIVDFDDFEYNAFKTLFPFILIERIDPSFLLSMRENDKLGQEKSKKKDRRKNKNDYTSEITTAGKKRGYY